MREEGHVITVRDGTVDVLMHVSSACGGCSVCSKGAGGETVMQDVRDAFGSTVGVAVEVEIPDSIRTRAAVAVFLVPVGAMLAGYLAGFLLGKALGFNPDVVGLIGAVLFANVAFIGVRFADKRLAGSDRFTPRVSAIVSRGHGRL